MLLQNVIICSVSAFATFINWQPCLFSTEGDIRSRSNKSREWFALLSYYFNGKERRLNCHLMIFRQRVVKIILYVSFEKGNFSFLKSSDCLPLIAYRLTRFKRMFTIFIQSSEWCAYMSFSSDWTAIAVHVSGASMLMKAGTTSSSNGPTAHYWELS